MLFGDVNILGLVDAAREEHYAEYDRQQAEDNAAYDVDRARIRRPLKLVKTKASGDQGNHRYQAVYHTLTSNHPRFASDDVMQVWAQFPPHFAPEERYQNCCCKYMPIVNLLNARKQAIPDLHKRCS